MNEYRFWLPDDKLDRSPAADEIRADAGLPFPPDLPQNDWWKQYQLVERALLRFRRAVEALPADSPRRAKLESFWPDAVAQLNVVAKHCAEGSRGPIRKRNPRRLALRRTQKRRQQLLFKQLAATVVAMERFGDVAARAAFTAAIGAASTDPDADLREAKDALTSVTTALDDLAALSRDALDP